MERNFEDIRQVALKSRKFREWRPRLVNRKVKSGSEAGKESTAIFERHYSVIELAKEWGLSTETIRDMFRSEPGVLKIGEPESKSRRGYITLRIPQSVAVRVHRRLSA